MPYLRKIRKAKWYKNAYVPWLEEGELQADVLVDLSTKNNELSVYQINDVNTDLPEVIGAIALTCDNTSNIDYALFMEKDLEELKIKVSFSEGDTPDDVVNLKHYDLTEITANKILSLTTVVKGGIIGRFTESNVIRIVAEALRNNRIDRSRIKLKEESLKVIEDRAVNL